MNSPTTSLSSTLLLGKLRRLRGLLIRRDHAKHNEPLMHFVLDSAPLRCDIAPTSTGNVRTDMSQVLAPARLCEARLALAVLLGRSAGGRRMLPSLALLERSLGKDDPQEMDNLPIWVLRHAVQTLDRLDAALFSDGQGLLRRHVEQTLRRRLFVGLADVVAPPHLCEAAVIPALAMDPIRGHNDDFRET